MGLPGQLVPSPMPVRPSSVKTFTSVQLYFTPSTSQTLTLSIFTLRSRQQILDQHSGLRRLPLRGPRVGESRQKVAQGWAYFAIACVVTCCPPLHLRKFQNDPSRYSPLSHSIED